MDILNPSQPQLPKELEKALEQAKNTLTITEQETKRLTGLARDQEAIIRGLLDNKDQAELSLKTAENKLADVTSRLEAIKLEIQEKTALLDSLRTDLKNAEAFMASLEEAKKSVSAILSSLES